jgi:hypothetical protein
MPDESGSTYNSQTKTVEYTLHLKKLPDTIFVWFNNLWASSQPDEFIKDTLGVECPVGLWTVFGEYTSGNLPEILFDNNNDLFDWLMNNLVVEREIYKNPNSIIIGSTIEFDWEYSFFDIDAISTGELGNYFKDYVKKGSDGEAILTTTKILLSAYL